jgi:carboxymethylenebutenolidase
MGEIVEFPSNGSTGQGYLAAPEAGGPGVIVIQEWWGLVEHIRNVCDRFAGAGFVALAPDLYRGRTVSEPDEAGKAMMAMQLDRAALDMSGLALVLACNRPDAVRAVVACYGVIPWPDAQPDYAAMSAAALIHCAERDQSFPPEAATDLGHRLRALGREAEVIIHPGADHAFFNDDRPEVYDAEAAAKLWDSSVAFLLNHLS